MDKGSMSIEQIVMVILILMALVILIVFFLIPKVLPPIKTFLETNRGILKQIGIDIEGGNEFIRSASLEKGVMNQVTMKFILMNDERIEHYDIKYSNPDNPTAETVWVSNQMVYESDRQAGHEYNEIITLPDIDGKHDYGPKIIRLYVYDNKGKEISKRILDYKGVFPPSSLKYQKDTESLNSLVNTLGSGGTIVYFKDDMFLAGFSSKYNKGDILISKKIWFVTLPFVSSTISMPSECRDFKSCLCICKTNSWCGNENDRMCYGSIVIDSFTGVSEGQNAGVEIPDYKGNNFLAIMGKTTGLRLNTRSTGAGILISAS
jgi:hypothetical protein